MLNAEIVKPIVEDLSFKDKGTTSQTTIKLSISINCHAIQRDRYEPGNA
jgi:hypothetical protein